ncbi:hypothetical protein, partial [Streptomyces sp. TRM68367]|uniref:hypothetical protein n=1 Tax=Streptomyces sp. TRM68367 TaxID=2758415 RepID=UPI001CA909AE
MGFLSTGGLFPGIPQSRRTAAFNSFDHSGERFYRAFEFVHRIMVWNYPGAHLDHSRARAGLGWSVGVEDSSWFVLRVVV